GRPEALQQEFWQLPGAVGLDVRHALHSGEGARAAGVRLPGSPERAHGEGRTGRAADQCRRPSQAAVAAPPQRASASARNGTETGVNLPGQVPECLDLTQPLLARFIADRLDHAVDFRTHWRDAGEMQDVALE